ncbi:tetratricopeptide repeat protein [Phormidesmis sp. 146-35]
MAVLYDSLNRLDEAKPLIPRTVAIFDRTLGQDHPHATSAHQWWQAIHNPKHP